MSAPSSELRCPGCGAPSAADARSCGYCGCSLATVACGSCYTAMFVGSKFCPRCGAEGAREVLSLDPIDCPACHREMPAIMVGRTPLRECSGCGGVWLEGGAFEVLCGTREPRARLLTVLQPAAESSPTLPAKVRYIPCPSCKKVMNRTNFARSSGIVLDVCKGHGVWLDSGELQRIVRFIDDGGVERARAKDRARQAEEQRLQAQRVSAGTAASASALRRASLDASYESTTSSFGDVSDIAGFIRDLLDG